MAFQITLIKPYQIDFFFGPQFARVWLSKYLFKLRYEFIAFRIGPSKFVPVKVHCIQKTLIRKLPVSIYFDWYISKNNLGLFFKYTSDFFQYYFIFIDHAAHLSDLPICR